ncbi:MAG: hypothetical protein M1833_004041 [Piccolia ochrophora]|nr:MAG: hypothetical protein M1833_004041 [Piccolia ochrophora]
MSSQYYSLPLYHSRQPQALRESRFKQKRKRDADASQSQTEGEAGISEDDRADTQGDVTRSSRITTGFPYEQDLVFLGREDAEQYRLAGHRPTEPLPPNFPHRPLGGDADHGIRRRGAINDETRKELANLSPALFVPNNASTTPVRGRQQTDPLLQHLSVLTTILHRCLQAGDFVRAGRAWGMILRTDVKPNGINIRADGRWGVGAEILLHHGIPLRTGVSDDGDTSRGTGGDLDGMNDPDQPANATPQVAEFTTDGFVKAKEYYEHLILQYPYQKYRPDAISALDFYPAMFGLWIYAVQQAQRTTSKPRSSPSSSDSHRHSPHDNGATSPNEQARVIALREAESIAERLDVLLLSPPYTDSVALLQLRGMVALWMADLCVPSHEESDGEIRDDENGGRREEQLKRARTAFRRVEQRGGTLWKGVKWVLRRQGRNDGEEMEGSGEELEGKTGVRNNWDDGGDGEGKDEVDSDYSDDWNDVDGGIEVEEDDNESQ